MKWAAYVPDPKLDLLFHTPSGMPTSKRTAARFVRLGMKAGIPDLCLPVPNDDYHGLFIEMKVLGGCRKCGSAVQIVEADEEFATGECIVCSAETTRTKSTLCSEEQRWWLAQLEAQGYRTYIATGDYDAIDEIATYLGLDPALTWMIP